MITRTDPVIYAHMLVYSPGGYRFSDFMRIGLLMNLIILAANILIVNILYPLA